MKKLHEFSKKFIVVATTVWIIGAAYGAIIVGAQLIASLINPAGGVVDLASYLTYLAVPLSGGVIGYMCKSAFENREKIKQNYIAPEQDAESEHIDD